MKKDLLSLLVFAVLSVCNISHLAIASDETTIASSPEGVLFEVDYDDYSVNAKFSKGSGKADGFNAPDLQLRMFPGVQGKGNALTLANSETTLYPMQGNFNPREGTISMWISPLNWKMSDEPRQVFFYASQKDYSFYIGKIWPNFVKVQGSYIGPDKKAYAFGAQIYIDPADWPPKRWHKIDFVWNAKGNKLYLDGTLHKYSDTNMVGIKSLPPTCPSQTFSPEIPFPEAAGTFCIGMPTSWKNMAEVNPEHQTAFDMVRIYGRCLSAEEIKSDYEKYFPNTKKQIEPAINFLTIPLTTKGAINLDGKIESGEWADAATAPLMTPALKPERIIASHFFIKRDSDNIYIALQGGDPCTRAEIKQADGNLWEDDSFEIHFRSPDQNNYQFIVNGNGATFDQLNNDKNWNAGARAAVFKDKDSWSVELQIPVKALGGDTALSSGEWGANFCATFIAQLKKNHFTWNTDGGSGFSPSGKVIFSKDATAVRLEKIGDLRAGQLDFLINAAGDTNTLNSKVRIDLEGQGQLPAPSVLFGSPWQRQLPAGRQILEVEVKQKNHDLFRYVYDYTVRRPLEISFDRQKNESKIVIELDLSNSGGKALELLGKDGIAGKVSMFDPDGKICSEKTFITKASLHKIDVPLPTDLRQGHYRIKAETSGEASSFVAEQVFRVPDLTPYKKRVAMDHSVPTPWTPVKKIADWQYSVLDREYRFDGRSPWPTQIISRHEAMFAQAPELLVDLGSGAQSPSWTSAKVTAMFDDKVAFSGSGNLGDLTFVWDGELYFDGLYYFKFSMNPASAVKIKSISMKWQVPNAHAKFFMNPAYVPWKEGGKIETDLLPGHFKDNVVWLVGHEKGLFWWTKSNANWVNKPGEKPIVATKKGEVVQVDLNIITVPSELTKPAEYTMAFMGTPSRTVPPEFRNFKLWGWGRAKGINVQYYGDGCFFNRIYPDEFTSMNSFIPVDPKKYAETLKTFANQGIRAIHYIMPSDVVDVQDDFDYLGKSGLLQPCVTHSGVKNGVAWTSYKYCGNTTDQLTADLWAYRQDELYKRFPGLGGFYYDVAGVHYCENPAHGCGGIDAFGNRFISSDAYGIRQTFLRSYKVAKAHGADKLIQIHCHIQFNPMAVAFCDLFTPGENTFYMAAKNPEWGYCEDITPEEYQTDYNWRTKGVVFGMLVQQDRAAGLMPAIKNKYGSEFMDNPEYAIRTLTPLLVHDFDIIAAYVNYKVIEQWWDLKTAVNLNKAEYHGYWESDAVKSANDKFFCGWYSWDKPSPYRRMLVVGNFTREEKNAALTLDKKALGIDGIQVEYVDLWNNNLVLSEDEVKNFKLKGNHFMLIGIK